MVAAYWGDVDTRPADGGTVWYRETSTSLLLSRFKDEIQAAFPNQREFTPTSLFIVTWDHVGYFNQKTDKVRVFISHSSVLLVESASCLAASCPSFHRQ